MELIWVLMESLVVSSVLRVFVCQLLVGDGKMVCILFLAILNVNADRNIKKIKVTDTFSK